MSECEGRLLKYQLLHKKDFYNDSNNDFACHHDFQDCLRQWLSMSGYYYHDYCPDSENEKKQTQNMESWT